jgi:hypothetical protein
VQAKLTWMLALAAGAALLAGCGGGSSRLSKADYEQKVQADGKSVQKAFSKVSISGFGVSGLAKQIPAARRALETAIDDLDKAKPPKDAEADNHTIVVALRTIDAQLVKLEAAAKKGDIAGLQSAGAAIQSSPEVKAAQRAAKDLKRKGYEIGVLGQT